MAAIFLQCHLGDEKPIFVPAEEVTDVYRENRHDRETVVRTKDGTFYSLFHRDLLCPKLRDCIFYLNTTEQVSKRTQGKRGQKPPRINMAFSPENLEHIKLMGRLHGVSATEYVNKLIETSICENSDIADRLREIERRANGGGHKYEA